MGVRSGIRSFWRNVARRHQVERDLNDELDAFVDELTERKVRAGMSPDDARKSALAEIGGVTRVKEGVRAERVGSAVESVFQDVGYAVRGLRRAPAFALAGVLTIGLGVGANSTAFTLVNAALLRELPFENPEGIAFAGYLDLSYRDWIEFRDQSRTIELAAYANMGADLSGTDSPPERVPAAEITAGTFSILGQGPALGRDLLPGDSEPGSEEVALIGHSVWQNRYGGTPDVVGRTIRINLRDHTIIGVMPEGEAFPQGTRIWVPLVPDDRIDERNIALWGRLAPGSTFEDADTELDTIAERIKGTYYPDLDDPDLTASVVPFRDRNVGRDFRTVAFLMLGAVGFVLLIACVNVANLLMSRVAHRSREVSIRAALGAPRSRVMRQLFVENVVMSLAGGLVGLAISIPAIDWFAAVAADTGPPYWLSFEMDYRVYAYLFFLCVAAALLFGLAPALQVSGENVVEFLKDGARGTNGSSRSRRIASVLIVGEIALTIVLLTGAGLMMRSFLNSQKVDWGVEIDGVLAAALNLPTARYDTPARTAFVHSLIERLQALPDLGSVTAASAVPGEGAYSQPVRIEGRESLDSERRGALVSRVSVVPGYFDAMGLTLAAGRDFSLADRGASPDVAIVDELFAARYWPGSGPIGQRFRFGSDENAGWLTVVGVSPRVYYGGPEETTNPQARPNFYVPYSQDGNLEMSILSRGGGSIENRVAILREELQGLDADLPLINIQTLNDVLWRRTWQYQLFGTLFVAFALAALGMAAVGLYGVMAYAVSQRTKEFGIRMAMGARPSAILWMVLRQGLLRTLAGLAIGLVAALMVGRALTVMLYEVAPGDPATFAVASLFLGLVALAACLIPARRAVRVDPTNALRTE